MIFGGGERTKNKSVYSGVGEAPDVGASVGCGSRLLLLKMASLQMGKHLEESPGQSIRKWHAIPGHATPGHATP
jgi:hypothetical protein